MSDWSREIVEQARRLPMWARVVIGAASVCVIVYAGFRLARQASMGGANALVVGLTLAAWIVVYIVMRVMRIRARKRPPR